VEECAPVPAPSPRFAAIWTAVLAAGCAAMTVHPEHEADAFWHLSLGRAVLAAGRRTIPEPLALPAFTSPAVVPEWLWGVITYAAHRAGSWPALVALTMLLAAAAAYFATKLVAALAPRAGHGAAALCTGLAMGAAMGRVRLRPEAVGVVLIPAFLLLALRYAEADGKRRLRLGAALAVLEVLWAQLHGSFVLAPLLFAVGAAPAVVRDRAVPERRSVHLAVAFALVAGLCTSAFGLDLAGYLAAHARGDAARHVDDMIAPTWAAFNPAEALDNPYGTVLVLLWLLGAAGMLHARRVPAQALALAILGAPLALDAIRFMPIAALLALPLAAEGTAALASILPDPARPEWRWAGAALGLAGLVIGARPIDRVHGPLGRIGPAEGVHPVGAATFLRGQPAGGAVLSVYNAGGSLGFLLAGHARTYVDGRTPLYFDDTDFAVSRDVFRHPDALARAVRRFGATALVLNRNAPVCAKVPEGFVPAFVEAHYTTFVPAGAAPPLAAVAPCGPGFLRPKACEGGALDEEIRRLAALGETPFVRYLRAERILRCGGALDEIPRLLPSRAEARLYLPQRDALEIAWRLRIGDAAGAVDLAEAGVRDGDANAVAAIAPALAGDAVPAGRARAVLEAAVERMDDAAPPDLRALLALACAAENDARGARLHGVRAAAAGSRQALPVLVWLRQHGDSARARADAAAWIDLLAAEAKPPPAGASAAPSSSPLP
jgi:uncharacterized membrane protein YccF (DUF307 family)